MSARFQPCRSGGLYLQSIPGVKHASGLQRLNCQKYNGKLTCTVSHVLPHWPDFPLSPPIIIIYLILCNVEHCAHQGSRTWCYVCVHMATQRTVWRKQSYPGSESLHGERAAPSRRHKEPKNIIYSASFQLCNTNK